ncbi:MAG: transglutaminase domain-containing protein [Lentisphaeria bacterium]|nr:transglutaminase domain-containing protein [Lentisphaeria bacterium]
MDAEDKSGTPLPVSLQLSYILLFGISIVAGLWQLGHALLVLGVLAAVLPAAGLARLPRRWYPGWLRQVLQVVVAALGLAWWTLRMKGCPLDLALAETMAILGISLCIGGLPKEYGFLTMISLILLGYGGLRPGRPGYVHAFAAYMVCGLLLFYQTRTPNLAIAGQRTERVQTPPYLGNWGYRLAHLALTAGLMLFLLVLFPMPQRQSIGVVPTGFFTTQDPEFPALWQRWIRPAEEFLRRSDDPEHNAADFRDPTGNPSAEDPNAQTQAVSKTPTNRMDAREGGGGGGVGTDLVMRVRSAAKLYWLVQLYDVYDGSNWRISPQLRRGRTGLDAEPTRSLEVIHQAYSVEKPASTRVPGAFRAIEFHWLLTGTEADPETVPDVAFRRDLAGAVLIGDTRHLPWRYRCVSSVPTLDSGRSGEPRESLARMGWNYRRLPEDRITERVRLLATQITAGHDTPLQKANALQAYLRANCAYDANTPAIPEDVDPVDHFLFESRAGYCQHFAQAFTVLARLVGLPARLATGYSPGTYNLLANCFEVYEYHAHAWTQIYVEPYGWLTFDGVAPGNLHIDAKPSFLRRLLDPFGEEWAARPPELSLRYRDRPTRPTRETSGDTRDKGGALAKTYEQIYAKALKTSGDDRPSLPHFARAAVSLLTDWLSAQWQRLREALGASLQTVWDDLRSLGLGLVRFLRGLSVAEGACLLALAAALALLWRRRRRLALLARACQRRWLCQRQWRRLAAGREGDPDAVVRECFRFAAGMLALGQYARPGRLDLLEYARHLSATDGRIGQLYGVLAEVVVRQVFRDQPPSPAEAARVYHATAQLRDDILARLSLSGRRLPRNRTRNAGPGSPAAAGHAGNDR